MQQSVGAFTQNIAERNLTTTTDVSGSCTLINLKPAKFGHEERES